MAINFKILFQERSSLYSDASTLVLRGNRIARMRTGAVDAIVTSLVFSDNVVDDVDDGAFSVGCLHGRVERNVFAVKDGEEEEEAEEVMQTGLKFLIFFFLEAKKLRHYFNFYH